MLWRPERLTEGALPDGSEPSWHALPASRALELLGGSPHGLTDLLSSDAVRVCPSGPVSTEEAGARPPRGRVHLVEPYGFLKV